MFKWLFALACFTLSTNYSIASIQLSCSGKSQIELLAQVHELSSQLEVGEFLNVSSTEDHVYIELKSPWAQVPTYQIHEYPELGITYESIKLPALQEVENGEVNLVEGFTSVMTVSKREILLTMSHPGRIVAFDGCTTDSLEHDIGVRQSIVAWSENMKLGWPDGGPAKWNTLYWHKGTPLYKDRILETFSDPFVKPDNYSLGCYTAAKLLVTQGVLDYVGRVIKSPSMTKRAVDRLYRDNDPLVNIEPPVLWAWEPDFDRESQASIAGKLLRIETNVHENSVVPGDWLYFLNPHIPSSQKVGYEGSNAIYTGMNRFASFYDPEGPRYSLYEKANDVYQWRNEVFNRPADLHKETPLRESELQALLKPPKEGGLLLPIRVVPIDFYATSQPLDIDLQTSEKIMEVIISSSNVLNMTLSSCGAETSNSCQTW